MTPVKTVRVSRLGTSKLPVQNIDSSLPETVCASHTLSCYVPGRKILDILRGHPVVHPIPKYQPMNPSRTVCPQLSVPAGTVKQTNGEVRRSGPCSPKNQINSAGSLKFQGQAQSVGKEFAYLNSDIADIEPSNIQFQTRSASDFALPVYVYFTFQRESGRTSCGWR